MDTQTSAKLAYNLKIIPVDEKGVPKLQPPFLAMFNPDQISLEDSIIWKADDTPGREHSETRYIRSGARSFTVELMVDGTGVNTGGAKIPVTTQILLFRSVAFSISGKDHRPNFLLLQYGDLIIHCVLKSSTVTYTAFDMAGLPIRAKINATFNEWTPGLLGNILSAFSSPDLSHIVAIKEYDLLPLLTKNIYKNQHYYLQVARANNLKNFRKLMPGTRLIFPPLSEK